MKINVENTERVQSELDRAQRASRAGIYTPKLVELDAAEAERRLASLSLTEAERRGAIWTGYSRSAWSKRWKEHATVITLERGTYGRWFLTHATRHLVHERVRSSVRTVNAAPRRVLERIASAEGVVLS